MDLGDLPEEILERIFLNVGDREIIEELRMADGRFNSILNGWLFWWKKAVKDGYTEMSSARYKRRMMNVTTSNLSYSDEQNIPEEQFLTGEDVYNDLRMGDFRMGYRWGNTPRDTDLNSNLIDYLKKHLNDAISRGSRSSILTALEHLKIVDQFNYGGQFNYDDQFIEATEAFIIAARRGNDFFDTLEGGSRDEFGRPLISFSDDSVICDAVKDELLSSDPDYDIIRRLLYLLDVILHKNTPGLTLEYIPEYLRPDEFIDKLKPLLSSPSFTEGVKTLLLEHPPNRSYSW